ncbi:MAG: DUF2147 domain-containing protein [Sphingopyxis sp.]|uniref:DUF2147 domain-containing protein n=1 Tax=Sphingopyxis sp. TaxID=1908224 RepID=UPI003D6D32E2
MKAIALALLLALPAAVQADTAPTPFGLWQNPKGTLLVRTRDCGRQLCGNIVWAGPKAIADAREAGVTALVGTELLIGYRPSGAGRWTGQVYVPDQGRRYYSTIEVEGPNSLRISGCILGGLICKHQEWTRR